MKVKMKVKVKMKIIKEMKMKIIKRIKKEKKIYYKKVENLKLILKPL